MWLLLERHNSYSCSWVVISVCTNYNDTSSNVFRSQEVRLRFFSRLGLRSNSPSFRLSLNNFPWLNTSRGQGKMWSRIIKCYEKACKVISRVSQHEKILYGDIPESVYLFVRSVFYLSLLPVSDVAPHSVPVVDLPTVCCCKWALRGERLPSMIDYSHWMGSYIIFLSFFTDIGVNRSRRISVGTLSMLSDPYCIAVLRSLVLAF